jgi:hypothetical protein
MLCFYGRSASQHLSAPSLSSSQCHTSFSHVLWLLDAARRASIVSITLRQTFKSRPVSGIGGIVRIANTFCVIIAHPDTYDHATH